MIENNNSGYDYRFTDIKIKNSRVIFKLSLPGITFPYTVENGNEFKIPITFQPKEVKQYFDTLIVSIDLPCLGEYSIPIIGVGKKFTDVNDEHKSEKNIFPNPASDFIEINGIGSWELGIGGKVQIFNILGECIPPCLASQATQQEWNLRIDISGLTAGVYFLRVGNEVKMFVKNN